MTVYACSRGKPVVCSARNISRQSESDSTYAKVDTSGRWRDVTFVCKVITHAENKIRRIPSILLHQPFGNLSLVDIRRSDFEVRFAGHDFDVPFLRHRVFEQLSALMGLKGAVLRVSSPIMPGERDAFAFDKGT